MGSSVKQGFFSSTLLFLGVCVYTVPTCLLGREGGILPLLWGKVALWPAPLWGGALVLLSPGKGRGQVHGLCGPGCESLLHCFLAVCPWGNYLTLLRSDFVIYEGFLF